VCGPWGRAAFGGEAHGHSPGPPVVSVWRRPWGMYRNGTGLARVEGISRPMVTKILGTLRDDVGT
jgi:hypothetical protein